MLIGGAVAFTYVTTPAKNNTTTVNNSMNTTTSTKTVADINIVANQTGPATAKKGDNVTINYSVSNNGGQAVNNVKIQDLKF